jgi:hypothetical protein
MNSDKEIMIELAKNRSDEIIVRQELESEKKKFIESLKNGMGEEIKMNTNELNRPIKYRKPFKMKVQEFLNNTKKVMGL